MADTAQADILKNFTVTDSGPSRKRLEIEVAAETVDQRLRDSVDTLLEEAELPGFRRGRVPKALLEKRFGSNIKNEARNQIVAEAYQQAVEKSGLKVIGDPFGTQLKDIEIVAGKPLKFGLDVEVQPEFTLPPLEGLELKRPVLEVSDTLVEEELTKICLNEGSLESHDSSKAGDYLTGNARMVDQDGVEHYNIEGAVVQCPPDGGKGMILGVLVGDLGKQLGLPKIGDSATISVKGPEQHEVEALRGKDLTITFEVTSIDKIIPLDRQELVTRFGLESEDALKDRLRERLEQRVKVQQATALRQQVARYLLENVQFPLPERITAFQAARAMERRRMELMYRGMDNLEIEQHVAELRAASAAEASQNLKLFFILNRVAEDMDVNVSENEARQRVAQMAFERGMRPEQMFNELRQSDRLQSVFLQIREHKALDAIIGKAKVTDTAASEFGGQGVQATD
ncbi:MAG: trigger factor [Phycisphaeraceae bacterium]|nr:trigger factor [Phycisphaeraceae bacterium]